MSDQSDGNRVELSPPHSLSAAQRAFVEGAEELGATIPADARPLLDLPRLSVQELADLVELGLVREASARRYYVFRSQSATAAGPLRRRWSRKRFLRMFLFWLVLALIPILLLRMTGG